MDSQTKPHAFFVYGTLKRGHLRQSVWPCEPLSVEPARIMGSLYDLGPYPGLAHGSEWVLGELWQIRPDDMGDVIRVLDQAEGYFPTANNNLYIRQVVAAIIASGANVDAYTYFFGDPSSLRSKRKIAADIPFEGQLCAAWPDTMSRVPKSFEEE